MRKHIVVLALGAALLVGASAQGQTDPAGSSCTPLKVVYAEKNWRDVKPINGRTVCPVRDRAGRRSTVEHFYLYRHYRQIATMRCTSGSEGYYVPNPGSCSTLECESHLSWSAYNTSSGADGVYQLLNHGEPWPVRTFKDRLEHHEIASTLSRSSWVC